MAADPPLRRPTSLRFKGSTHANASAPFAVAAAVHIRALRQAHRAETSRAERCIDEYVGVWVAWSRSEYMFLWAMNGLYTSKRASSGDSHSEIGPLAGPKSECFGESPCFS